MAELTRVMAPKEWVKAAPPAGFAWAPTSKDWVEPLPPAGFVWADDDFNLTDIFKPVAASRPVTSFYDGGVQLPSPPAEVDIDELVLEGTLGKGTQSEVLFGKLPGIGQVAVKLGIKQNAIAREFPVLSVMSGFPRFPSVIYHEPAGQRAVGGILIMDMLGPALEDIWRAKAEYRGDQAQAGSYVDGQTLLRMGREMLRALRQLHLEGFVHNDIKPANILLARGSNVLPARLHLIDFGSCTKVEGHVSDVELPPSRGAIGTLSFASVAADGPRDRPMRPADDIESLVFTLAALSGGSWAGRLPWTGKPDVAASMKVDLLTSSDAATELTNKLHCKTAAVALQGLLAEVRRVHEGATLNHEACLAALGGKSWEEEEAEADGLSEYSLMTSLGIEMVEVTAEEDDTSRL